MGARVPQLGPPEVVPPDLRPPRAPRHVRVVHYRRQVVVYEVAVQGVGVQEGGEEDEEQAGGQVRTRHSLGNDSL